ncbi:MAG: hypothetical protein ACRDTH_21725 [Pseudonocardiaceae bacterium]
MHYDSVALVAEDLDTVPALTDDDVNAAGRRQDLSVNAGVRQQSAMRGGRA